MWQLRLECWGNFVSLLTAVSGNLAVDQLDAIALHHGACTRFEIKTVGLAVVKFDGYLHHLFGFHILLELSTK